MKRPVVDWEARARARQDEIIYTLVATLSLVGMLVGLSQGNIPAGLLGAIGVPAALRLWAVARRDGA